MARERRETGPSVISIETLYYKILFFTDRTFDTDAFAQKLLHTGVFIYRDFYTQAYLHTDAFTHKSVYTQTLLHSIFNIKHIMASNSVANICRHFTSEVSHI